MSESIIPVLFQAFERICTLWFVVGLVSTFLCSFLLTPYLGQYIRGYKDLGSKKGDFNTRIGSSIHAFTTFSFSLYLLLFDPRVTEDKVGSPSRISECVMEYSCGYFIADYVLVLIDPVMRYDLSNHAHHFVSFSGTALSRYLRHMVFFVIYRYVNEISTVFVNMFSVLHTLHMQNTTLYFIVSSTMVVTFFFCRILLIPVHWVLIYTEFTNIQQNVAYTIKWYTFVVYPTFDVLNIIWFSKMVRGMKKLLKKRWKTGKE